MKHIAVLLALVCSVCFSSQGQAQVVPFDIHGSFIGNLVTLEATGQAQGTHLGNTTFVVYTDPVTQLAYDVYTAADGSQLMFVRVGLEVDIIDAGNGLVNIVGTDYWDVIGGTGRFANVSSAGSPIISSFYTPNPVSLADPTHIPADYVKSGLLDLGNK